MSEQNKAVLHRHFEEVWSQGNLALVDELFASDCLGHAPPEEIEGREGLKRYVSAVRTAFPDLQVTVEDQIVEGDRVVTRWTARGTHRGEFQGITQRVPATGKQGSMTGITIARVTNGKFVEGWTNFTPWT